MPDTRSAGRQPLLDVVDLCAGYGKVPVVTSVSFTICSGEFTTLLGRNGAGKTTLLNALTGLLAKKSGSVRFAGVDISAARPASIVRLGLVHVLQGHRVFPSLSVHDNLLLSTLTRPRIERAEGLASVYDMFPELAERRTYPASRLSGGQQQILAVAQGLVAKPSLLILDEPSLGLAPLVVERILTVASEICRRGAAILLVEQLVGDALLHADSVLVMKTGRIVSRGTPAELKESDALRDIYLGAG